MTQAAVCAPAPARRKAGRKGKHEPPRPALTEDERAARDDLVVANLPLVVFWAKRYVRRARRKLDFDDLVQEGRVGLMKAAELFDPGRGVRFSTYASLLIKQAIGRALAGCDLVRVPHENWADLARWLSRSAALANELGREPAELEIAGSLSWGPRRVAAVRLALKAARTFRPVFPHHRTAPPPSELAEANEEAALLRRAIARLSPRRREVVESWLAGEPLHKIGERLGMGRGAASQLGREAVTDLRAKLMGGPTSADLRRARDQAARLAKAGPGP